MKPTTGKKYEFEIGLSFKSTPDESFAKRLADRLKQETTVYIYTDQQKEAAAKKIADYYVDVFKNRVRMAVVIYRQGWGETKITGFEEAAIVNDINGDISRAQKNVFIVTMDGNYPGWFATKIYEDGKKSIDSIATAILFHLKYIGGDVSAFTAAQKLELHREKEAWRKERQNYLHTTSPVIKGKCIDEFNTMINKLEKRLTADFSIDNPTSDNHPASIQGFYYGGFLQFKIDSIGYAVVAKWKPTFDTLQDNKLLLYIGSPAHPTLIHNSDDFGHPAYTYTVDKDYNPGWSDIKEPDSFFTSDQVSERIYSDFVEKYLAIKNKKNTGSGVIISAPRISNNRW